MASRKLRAFRARILYRVLLIVAAAARKLPLRAARAVGRAMGRMAWYIVARETSVPDADRSIAQLKQLGIEFVDADWSLAHEAGGFKAKHKMSFADCFAAALAKQRKAHLATGDPEFKQIESDISINWLK